MDLWVIAAFQVGVYRTSQNYPRDIIVKFPASETKANVLEAYWDNPNPVIEGTAVSIYSDLFPPPFTLKKKEALQIPHR